MKKKYMILAILIIGFTSIVFAKDDISKKLEDLKKEKDLIQEQLIKEIKEKDSLQETIKIQQKEIEDLNSCIEDLNNTITNITNEKLELNDKINIFEGNKGKIDEMRIKYLIGRLWLPYSKEGIKYALSVYNEISSQEEKDKYSSIPLCLYDYEKATAIILSTLQKIQNLKEKYGSAKIKEWKDEANQILKQNNYTNLYTKKYKEVSIYFLDDILKETKTRINSADDPETVYFEDLIIRLNG